MIRLRHRTSGPECTIVQPPAPVSDAAHATLSPDHSGAPLVSDDGAAPSAPSADEALIARVRDGDPAAAELFVRRHGPQMLAVARRFFRNEQDAEDAVQDAFVSAFRSLPGFTGQSKLSTWLHRIVVNACLMKLRSARRRPAVSIETLLPSFDDTGHQSSRVPDWKIPSDDPAASDELRRAVRDAIDDLPEPYRLVLLLRDMEELDTEATAEALELSIPAVKTRLHRARQALRTLLEQRLGPDLGAG